ncbi:TonB-dependent receptor plug domain-containing protein [Providencia sneebia]|uniref:Heme receptorHasR/TonB-dependent receptor n=1 Tax=Providencia sneebia DSM 19967 TaxID=1141660 RepID=K8WK77_9GAMM|nr:TonB-dependent receptor plug domain-containing protein [Providencia sneebia]EKT60954.1 heme receptorHasR/TonB-dependent receptor [Providencia sneebia DSM 19967]
MKLNSVTMAIMATLCIPTISSAEQEKEDLGNIAVQDSAKTIKERDNQGYDSQYDKNGSRIYLGKDLVERYKGTSSADVLNSAIGVYSGDARNSSALDPNIRGIQGQERVPVTVDGTEQAITVYRGYNGANNRNYIDPNLISSIEIEKSGSLTSDIKTSTGGGIAIKTIGIDDIVDPNEKFGISLKLETSSNSVKPRIPNLSYGQDYRDIPILTKDYFSVFNDPVVNIVPKSRGNAGFFNFKDNGGRIAIGTRQARFNLMAVYSYRKQGNYFAGNNGAHQYREPIQLNDLNNRALELGPDPYLPFAANVFEPSKEVTNTSNEMESYLTKANLYLTDSQILQLGFRHSKNTYGEIMPSRLGYREIEGKNVLPQWPLSRFTVNAYQAEYAWKPENNPWVNLNMNLWMTEAVGNTHTSGGFPREAKQIDYEFLYEKVRDSNIDGTLINTAKTNSINDRIGFNLRNTFALTSDLDLTVSGSMLKEKLDSNDTLPPKSASPFIASPRKGRRQEHTLAFNINYRPTSWLELEAGAKYIDGWTEDDFLKENILKRTDGFQSTSKRLARKIDYSRILTQDEYNRAVDLGYTGHNGYSDGEILNQIIYPDVDDPDFEVSIRQPHQKSYPGDGEGAITIEHHAEWWPDKDGRYTRKTNPFYNGTIDTRKRAIDPTTGQETYVYDYGDEEPGSEILRQVPEEEQWELPGKQKSYGWAPAFGSNVWLTDDDRIYARYIETVRLPTIFENTVGFSGQSDSLLEHIKFKPERGKTFEFGYSRNLQSLLNVQNNADIKINYYHTIVENIFDRDARLNFTQLQEQRTAGIEAQARYDNGGFYINLGVDYRLQNKVCDDAESAKLDVTNRHNTSECTTAGFPGGFLRTQLQPQYAINANLGLRLLDESLEIGSRIRYTSRAENKDEKKLMKLFPAEYSMANNSPMHWTPTFVADLYANYQIGKNTDIEFLVTNLTDQYYIDPLTRSMMPAPGRTFRLGISSRF